MFEQERMIGRLQRRVVEAPEIYACFLSGSFGRRAEDEYSDLDVALVYADKQAMEQSWRNRVHFAKSIMPYVALKSFDAEHIRPYFHIVLFANGSKLDFRFEVKDVLAPNPWDGQVRILKDTDGWAEDFHVKSAKLAFPRQSISIQELQDLDQRFWVMYWDVLRLLSRGNAEKSFPIYLELLYFTIPRLLDALPEGAAARDKLIEAKFDRNTQSTAKRMKDLLNAYKAARRQVVEQHHLQFTSDRSFENQIERLVDKLT